MKYLSSIAGFLCLLLGISDAFADWQTDLEAVFDHVSTFDELQDWHGGTLGATGNSSTTSADPRYQPKKLDGSNSMWQFWTNDTHWDSGGYEWIGPRETEYVWRGSKSFCLNYKNLGASPGIDGHGPSRLSTFFGDGVNSTSGYAEIHVFFMTKFHKGFFKELSPGVFEYISVVKYIDIGSGFTANRYWGTASEHSQACAGVFQTEYGLNANVMNPGGGGASSPTKIYFRDTILQAKWQPDLGCYKYSQKADADTRHTDLRIEPSYLSGAWLGVEVVMNKGNVDQDNGWVEFIFYDESGTEICRDKNINMPMMRVFDHNYNKVTLGGNRIEDLASEENRIYFDDFIVHGSSIGPTYFALLSGAQPPEPDIKPKNVGSMVIPVVSILF